MNQTEFRKLTQEGEEDVLSHYRVVKNKYGEEVGIPVVDVRDGLGYRALGYQMTRSNNRSRYITYNQYHTSRKSKKQI
jgi:hypothetical protein